MSSASKSSQTLRTAGWHFARGKVRAGPVSLQQLQKMAAGGELAPTDRVLRPGGKQWERAGSVPELFGSQRSESQTAAVASAPPPTARFTREPEPEEELRPPANVLLRLVLIGGAAMFVLLIGAGLLAYCLIGESTPQAAMPAPEEPHETPPPRPGKSPPKKVVLTPRQIATSAAIQKGAAYLRQRMASGGKFYHFADREGGANTGAVALLGLTLLESGANSQDADVQKAATQVRQHAQSLKFTYSIALSILFLDRLSADRPKDTPAEDAELIRRLALRLIGSQNAKAGWDYHCRVLSSIEEQNLLKNLESGQHKVGDTAKNVPVREYDDNSIGQFVTLALWTARKHNTPVRSTLLAIEERYRAKRRPEGNWSYNETNPYLKDSSTCAALIGLAVGRGIRDKEEVGKSNLLKDDAVMSGLDHIKSILKPGRAVAASEIAIRKKHTADMEAVFALMETTNDQKEFDAARAKLLELDKSPLMSGHFFGGDNWGDLYFLWSLERLCMIYGLDKIGEVDWHEWGSDFILTSQQADGSWQERFPGVPDTCFAMLFLMRANVAKDLTDKLRELMQGPGVQQQPGVPPKRE